MLRQLRSWALFSWHLNFTIGRTQKDSFIYLTLGIWRNWYVAFFAVVTIQSALRTNDTGVAALDGALSLWH